MKRIHQFTSLLIAIAMGLTACSKTEETKTSEVTTASVAEAQAMPMSAAPADDKNAPVVINDSNATADLGGADTADVANATAENMEIESASTGENVDNSAMEHISEDAEVIDDTPASPNAPKADESKEQDMNQKVNK